MLTDAEDWVGPRSTECIHTYSVPWRRWLVMNCLGPRHLPVLVLCEHPNIIIILNGTDQSIRSDCQFEYYYCDGGLTQAQGQDMASVFRNKFSSRLDGVSLVTRGCCCGTHTSGVGKWVRWVNGWVMWRKFIDWCSGKRFWNFNTLNTFYRRERCWTS